jgi:hypothetical protein
MNNDIWTGNDGTMTGAIQNVRNSTKSASVDLETVGIHDDEALTIFALNFLAANINDAFEGLGEDYDTFDVVAEKDIKFGFEGGFKSDFLDDLAYEEIARAIDEGKSEGTFKMCDPDIDWQYHTGWWKLM